MHLQRLTGRPRPPGMAQRAARAPASWTAGGTHTGMKKTSRTLRIAGHHGTVCVALEETVAAQGKPGVQVVQAQEMALLGGALVTATQGTASRGDRLAGACLRMRTETGVGPRGVTTGAAQSESPALEVREGQLRRGRPRPTTLKPPTRLRRMLPPLPVMKTRWRTAPKQRFRMNLKQASQTTQETILPKTTPKLTTVMQLRQLKPKVILNMMRPKLN